MADYKVELGVNLDMGDVDRKIEGYKKPLKVKAILDTNSFSTTLGSLNLAPVDIKSELNTTGWATTIRNYGKGGTKGSQALVNVKSDLNTDGITTKLSSYEAKPIDVGANLKASAIKDIKDSLTSGTYEIELGVNLDDNAVVGAIDRYVKSGSSKTLPIKIKPDFADVKWSEIETKIGNYTPTKKLKVGIDLQKGEINKKIAELNEKLVGGTGGARKLKLGVTITNKAVANALSEYKKNNANKLSFPVDLTLGNDSEFTTKLEAKINAYETNPVEIPVRLMPAAKNFDADITKTPIQVNAELKPNAINNAIEKAPKSLSKIPLDVKLVPKDINGEIKRLPKPTEPFEVNAKLNEKSINDDIALFKPTATLGIQPDLIFEDVEEQISTYVPKSQIRVNVRLDDNDVDEKTGKQNAQPPIVVNVKLDPEDVNRQIKGLKPSAKVKVGVALDNDYIEQQIQDLQTGTPVELDVELNTEPAKAEIEKLKSEFKKFGTINIQFPNANIDNKTSGSGNSGIGANSGTNMSGATKDVENFTASVNNAKNVVTAMKKTLRGLGVDLNDVNAKNVTKDIHEMGIEVQKVVTTINGNKLKMSVTGIQETENGIKRIVTETRNYEGVITNAENISKRFTQTFETSADAAKKFEKEVNEAYTDVYNTKKRIGDLEVELIGAEAEKDLERIKVINKEIDRLKGNLTALDKDGTYSSNFTDRQSASLKELDAQIEYQKKYAKSNLVEDIKLDIDTGEFDKDISNIETKLKGLGNVSKELRNNITQLKSNKTRMGNALESGDVDAAIRAYERYLRILETINNQLKISGNTQKFIDVDFSKLEKLKSEIDSIKKKIENLDPKVNTEQLSELSTQLKTLEADYTDLYSKLKNNLTTSQTDKLTESAQKAERELEELKAKIADVKAQLAKKIKIGIDDGTFDNDASKITSSFNKIKNKTAEAQTAMDTFEAALTRMKAAAKNGSLDELIKASEDYERALKAVKNQLDINARAEKNAATTQKLIDDRAAFQSKIDAWLTKNSAAASQFGARLLDLKAKAEKCDRVTLDHLEREFKQVDKEAEAAGLKMQTFGDRLKSQFAKYSSYFSVASLFIWASQGLRNMFEQVKLIDSAMTELKKVTNETDETYNNFLKNAATRSREIGTTIDGLVSSTADFARLGYGFEDAQGLAEVANIYAVVGDEIEGVEQATESLISTMAAFKDSADGMSNSDFAMSIVDKFNEIGNNFAISSGGIGEALERSASSLDAANNTLDESIALITAANTVVQDPEVVGTAFKTISMRIRGAKTELEEAGLETEGMVESTAKLREEIQALSGVDIMETDGKTFKSTYDIMDELADKWEDLSDIQQATITELVAGKRQGNIMSSLMANFDIAEDALETSLNSSGSAMAEHEKWQKSLEAQINKLKASWQSLSQTFLSSDFLKVTFDLVIKLVDGITLFIDKVGVLPTLFTGFAIFKSIGNGGLFKTFNTDLDGFANKIGIANKSFAELISAFKSANTTGGIKGFTDGLKSMSSALVSGLSDFDKSAIAEYNKLVDQGAVSQEQLAKVMQGTSAAAQNMVSAANGGKVALSGVNAAGISAALGLTVAKVAAMAFNAALTMGVSLAIQGIIEGLKLLTKALFNTAEEKKELAEKVDELTSKFKDQHEELKKLKGDYDTSSESSMISRYEKLSKGVDNLGRSVSLTADEYSEYQSIVNKIAEQIPSLVSGYDAQGNALLSCKGNVEELTAAYEKLIHAQNQEVLTNAGDIEEDFKNTVKDADTKDIWTNSKLTTTAVEGLEQMVNDGYTSNEILKFIQDTSSGHQIIKAFEKAGVDTSGWTNFHTMSEHLEKMIKNEPQKIQGVIDNFYAQFAEAVEQQKTMAQAKLSEAFDISSAISGLSYDNINEELQAVAHQTVANLDLEFFTNLSERGKTVEQWTTEMLDQLNALSSEDATSISAAFDLQTQFNGGKISYGEYVKGLEDTGNLIERLNLKPELESQLKLSLGLDEEGLVAGYKQLRNRLSSEEYFDIMPEDYTPFIKGLTSEEIPVLWKIIPELEETDYKETIEDVKDALRREMVVQGLTFDLNLEVESTGIEALNTALAESVSATGLSSESISALKGRYSELESQGYDLSSMFEETSNGIHLNRNELNKLEKVYSTQKLDEVNSDLAEMKVEYDKISEELKTCSDEAKAGLYNDQLTLAQKISEAATLASQYEGLTSAYNDWLAAEEAGQERDMYENIIEGFENIDDEISRGWIDDGAIEFLELLTGKTDLVGKSGKQLKEVYDGLDKTIKNTTHSIRDFFTVDEDGNSTNTGVYNFLDAVGQLEEEKFGGKDVVKRDKDGNVIGFDFELAGGDEVIAEALGVSEELVQIMVRAADDAGFVVSLDGTYRQLADLQNEAKTAADYLKEIGKTDFEFDFNTSSVESLNTQLNEAHKILDNKDFWNKDGTFNFNADGAQQAMEVVSTLQAKLDYLTQDKYGIGLTVEDEEFEEPLTNLQEYGRTIQTLNQLKLNPKVNAEEIEECETKLDELAQEFNELDTEKKLEIGLEIEKGVALTQKNLDKLTDEKKIKLGFVDGDGKPLTNVVDVIQNKIESGEVTIPTVLDIQANMDKNIEKLADLAWLNSGFLTDDEEKVIKQKYNIEVEADEVDTSNVDEKVDNALHGGGRTIGGSFALSREANVEIIAETFGIEDVDDLSSKLKGLDDKTVKAVAKAIGKIQVDELKQAVTLLKPNEVEAIAKAIGKGDVTELSNIIGQLSPKTVDAIANALGYDDVNDLRTAVENLDPKTVEAVANALGIADVEGLKGAIDNLQPKTVNVEATTSGEEKLSGLKSIIDSIKSKTVTITSWFKKITSGGSTRNDSNGFNDVNGTANVDGTTGRAFKQGFWGTKNSGSALVGELGREILVRNGRYYTIGDNGAEFIKYQKGDIIFNHRQTEELFANGRVTSGGGRGKTFASGTAFSKGTGGGLSVADAIKEKIIRKKDESAEKAAKKAAEAAKKAAEAAEAAKSVTGSKGGGDSENDGGLDKVDGSAVGTNSEKDKFEETFDFVEIALSRIQREIDNLDKKANNVYKSWSSRNTALSSEISKVGEEIKLQQSAAQEYLKEANQVGLSESYTKKIREGALSIEDFEGESDEKLVEKIKDYQTWYNKYLDCLDAAEELKETESELYAQRFENIQTQYDGILQGYEHTEAMLNEYISQAEAQGHIVSEKYYNALIENEKQNINTLKQEQADLIAERDKAVAEGKITKNSETWLEQCAAIDEVTQSIEEANTALIEYNNSIRDIEWEKFDLIQERISDITAESEFLIELMSNKDLFDDNGKFTEQGIATVGLHALNYNTSMYQADDYGKEVAKLDKQIAKDPYDQELINRRRELLELQRESILSAEDEKNAIRDLVEEGINLELDALQERIDLHNEELDSMKDLYDYQKNVEEQTKNIATLRKQLGAYAGFDDEETRAKVQELKVSLEEAEADLQETEYDKFISDQTALLDTLYTEYETVLNSRLDNVDFLLEQVIDGINMAAGAEGTITSALGENGAIALALGNNATTIGETLKTEVGNVGMKLSTAMNNIWTADGSGKAVIDLYGKDFQSKYTTTNDALNNIKADVAAMVDDIDKDAQKKVAANKTTTSAKKNPTTTTSTNKNTSATNNKSSNKPAVTDNTLKGIAAAIWVYGKSAGWEDDPTRKNKLTEKLGVANAKKVQGYINELGANGGLYKYWYNNNLKLDNYKYSAFKLGARNIDKTQMAWTQEDGQEYIVRPSDGAILTPIARGDSVLNATASGNIWNMANNPAEFIKDNLKLEASNVPNGANVQNSYTQHIGNVVFRMDNIKNYEEMLYALRDDKRFEKLITAMTIDRVAGKSSLAKGKAIR